MNVFVWGGGHIESGDLEGEELGNEGIYIYNE